MNLSVVKIEFVTLPKLRIMMKFKPNYIWMTKRRSLVELT